MTKKNDGTLQLFTIKDIPLKVHWSFGLLISLVVFIAFTNGLDLIQVFWFSFMIFSLFSCVIFHEYGHVLTAKYYKVNTRDIIISPIGGFARLENMPVRPKHELVIAIAGPIVNLVIAGLAYSILTYCIGNIDIIPKKNVLFSGFWGWMHFMFYMNCVLFGFNLIPAFPMDGGRILRAILASKTSKLNATIWAGNIGKFLSLFIFAFALYQMHPILAIISIFIFYMAHKEMQAVRMEDRLIHTKASTLMRQDFTSFKPHQLMTEVKTTYIKGDEQSFVILDDDENIKGVLHELFILDAIKNEKMDSLVLDYQSPNILNFGPEQSLKQIRDVMDKMGLSLVAIVDNTKKLQGVISRSDIIRFMNQKS